LGGPTTYFLSWTVSIFAGIPIYYFLPSLAPLNMTWIFLTFITMCLPAVIAFGVLHAQNRHSSLRYNQRSAYVNRDQEDEEEDTEYTSLLTDYGHIVSSWTNPLSRSRSNSDPARDIVRPAWGRTITRRIRRRTRWIPQSYVRFLWFCAAIVISLCAFIFGELYAEIYLRTLPHSNFDAVIYVYSWVLTIYALDGLTGWILGSRVNSYPLGFVFKLYFSLTYQVCDYLPYV